MTAFIPFRVSPRTDIPRPKNALPLAGSAHVWWRDESAAQNPVCRARIMAPRVILPSLPSDRPLVMGIVNVTPDSFSDGGTADTLHSALARTRALVDAGADILDIGGESTRPGASVVPLVDEIARTAPVIAAIRAAGITTPISIDTRKAAVAEAALHAGADIVNDVSALGWDPDLARVTAEAGAPICLMHAQGTPQTMQSDPRYGDVLLEVYDYLARRMDYAVSKGIHPERIITDPGIGFGKTVQHNLTLLQGLALLHSLGAPILLGASRKGFIGAISGVQKASARMPGSLAVALSAAAQGAQIIRVHDVAETVQALALWRALTTEEDGK
ncbi:dihydropteroate synthase [Pararhodobacter zhoushanensis]|uniref:Dihydropteroate synthase n=1 Tax=Pararhodobacter zhoushanensis TaxID=2479545 RepID=A0ABT3H3W4_9RHOB|nr:dihydropteroate synthase [Pararhodobacter zhoushanensis]MCW1934472.1 dihydropteroate synthase [Pararhodobacter zhoushanensis]